MKSPKRYIDPDYFTNLYDDFVNGEVLDKCCEEIPRTKKSEDSVVVYCNRCDDSVEEKSYSRAMISWNKKKRNVFD